MSTIHVANLSNGLLCPHIENIGNLRYSRIQSTHCEQKRWAQVVSGAGPDILMNLALGHTLIVHDKSERRNETRACWQGLAFVRFACETQWGLPVTPVLEARGPSMEGYFREVLRRIGEPTIRLLDYYSRFNHGAIDLRSCKMWSDRNGSPNGSAGPTGFAVQPDHHA